MRASIGQTKRESLQTSPEEQIKTSAAWVMQETVRPNSSPETFIDYNFHILKTDAPLTFYVLSFRFSALNMFEDI